MGWHWNLAHTFCHPEQVFTVLCALFILLFTRYVSNQHVYWEKIYCSISMEIKNLSALYAMKVIKISTMSTMNTMSLCLQYPENSNRKLISHFRNLMELHGHVIQLLTSSFLQIMYQAQNILDCSSQIVFLYEIWQAV